MRDDLKPTALTTAFCEQARRLLGPKLTFTIAGIDRALSRRHELTALRLIGTPGRLHAGGAMV